MSSAVQQGSLGSSGSSILAPTPRWNFHGLIDPDAETQSQYYNDDFECIESQKENIAVDEVMQEPEEDPITINEPNPLSGPSPFPTMARASNLHNASPPRKTRPVSSLANAVEPTSQDSFLNTFPDRPPPGYIKPFSNNNMTVSQIRGDHDDSDQRRRIPAPDSEPDDAEPKAVSDNGSQLPDDEEEEEMSSAQERDELPRNDRYAADAPRPTSQPIPRASQLSEAESTQPASATSVHPYITHDIKLRALIVMTINNYGESARSAWCQKLSECGIAYEDAWRIRTSDYMRAPSEAPSDGIIVVDSASQTFEDEDEECEATQPNPGSNAVESEPYEATQPNPGSNGPNSREGTQPVGGSNEVDTNDVDSFDPTPQIAGSDVEDSFEETQQIAGSNIVESSPVIPPRALQVLAQVASQADSSIVPETAFTVDVDMEDKMPLAQLIKRKPPSKLRPPSRQTQRSPALPANTSITSDEVVPDSLELTQEPVSPKKPAKEAPTPAKAGPSKPESKPASTPKPPPKSKPTPKPKPKTTPRVATTPATAKKRKRADSDASPVVKEEEQAEGTKRAVRPKKKTAATPVGRRQPARGRKGKQRERQDTEALSGDDEDPMGIKREPGSAVLDGETPRVKRQRVNSGSLRRKQVVELPEPVRVFAKTKAGEWWPARVTGRTSTGFSVDFDDATSCVVGLQDLRAFQLRKGDEGFIDVGETMRFFAISQNEEADAEEVAVVFGEDDEGEVLPVESIRFLGKYVKTNWDNRRLTGDLKVVDPAGRTTRAVKRDGLFAEFTFLPTGFLDGDSYVDALKRAGASVLKGWEDIFNFNKSGDSLRNDAVRLRDGAHIGRIFLLSHESKPTPKYLIAIALGVPCVRIGWTTDSIKAGSVLDWTAYLLPAGKAYHINRNIKVSQHVNLEWDQEDATSVWTNPVSRKPFEGKKVLCVGPAYISDTLQNTGGIPYIILAMGAKRVDILRTVSDKKMLKQYDYILHDNKGLVVVPQDPAYTIFDQDQLKSSLFLGRLMF